MLPTTKNGQRYSMTLVSLYKQTPVSPNIPMAGAVMSAHYSPDSTTVAINRVLKEKESALVVPVLVAHDEMFQVKIIGDGISRHQKFKRKSSLCG